MSSLLRNGSFAVLERPRLNSAPTSARIFGARVLRGDNVDVEKPVSLAVPKLGGAAIDPSVFDDIEDAIEEALPPPDFTELAEAARLQGYNEGHEQGFAAGIATAEEQMAGVLRQLSTLVGNVHEAHSGFFRAAERQVVDLALQIAQKVIEREVENMPDLAVNVIRAALEEMDARTAVRVRVNPDDEELLRRRWPQVVPPGVGADRIELQKDERVQTGGAVIETNHGQVDAQLESKLQQLGNALWTFVMDANSRDEQAADRDA